MRPSYHAIALSVACVVLLLTALPARSGPREDCAQTKSAELALQACGDLIRRYPDKAVYYYNRGLAHYARGDADSAIADYDTAIRLKRGDALVHAARGRAFLQKNDNDGAITDFDQALRLAPRDPERFFTYFSRGVAWQRKSQFQAAIRDFNEAVRLSPRYSPALAGRCRAYVAIGEYDRAIADCSDAIALDRIWFEYNDRGLAYLAKGDHGRAMVDFNEAIRLGPTEGGPLNNRGVLYTQMGDYDKAIADFNEALTLDPKASAGYHNRGTALTLKGELERALVDLDEAIRLDPASVVAFVRRGQMWEAKGEGQKAVADYEKALSLTALIQRVRDEQGNARRRLAALLIATPPQAVKPPTPVAEAVPPKVSGPVIASPPQAVPPHAPAGRRVALAIGNASYRSVDPLLNTRKDAADIGAALQASGFADVRVQHDLGLRAMQRALADFEEKATGADWAVVYYAGHAIQVDGRNYLVPVDAELRSPADVEDETVVLERVLARIAAAGKLRLVILDACRTNPFRRTWSGAKTRAVAERGLARVAPKEPNVLVAYAAADGEAALDGSPGENSPYVKALLKHLAMPGLELGKLFRLVRDDVMKATAGRQQPFEYGSLSGEDLFFQAVSR